MAECHPVGFQWVVEAQRRGARVIHVDPRFTRTSAIADLHVPIRAGQRHRVPRRPRPPRDRERPLVRGVRARLHEREHRSSARSSRTPRTSTGCSPAGIRSAAPTTRSSGSTQGSTQSATADCGLRARPASRPTARTAAQLERRRPRSDPTLQHPALRLPDPEAPLPPLHARGGRAGVRRAAPRASSRSRTRCARTPAASARPRSCTRSAGPSTRWACSTSAPPRSCSCCSGTSAGPAGASWPCADTRRSRARRTSRRSTTSCPAICRCRRPSRDGIARGLRRGEHAQDGLLGPRRRVRGEPAEGVVGRRRRRGQRLLLRLASAHRRRPLHLPDDARHARRQGAGLLRAGREPGGRVRARQAAPARDGPARLAGRA